MLPDQGIGKTSAFKKNIGLNITELITGACKPAFVYVVNSQLYYPDIAVQLQLNNNSMND